MQQKAPLLRLIVSERRQLGHVGGEPFDGLEVDDKLDFSRLKDRQIGGLRSSIF